MSRRKTYPDAPLPSSEELGLGTPEEREVKRQRHIAELAEAMAPKLEAILIESGWTPPPVKET